MSEDLITREGGSLQTAPGSDDDTIRLSLAIDEAHYAWIELDEEGVDLLMTRLAAWKKLLRRAARQ
jgi:hypothetical protein